MDLGSIFLILALLILVGLFVARPFLEKSTQNAHVVLDASEDHDLSALLAERDRILNSLQELDFDHALGKIPEEDYPEQRTYLLQQGADVLRQLDELQSDIAVAPAGDEQSAEDRIEAVIAARRADGMQLAAAGNGGRGAIPGTADDSLEVMLANRRRTRQEKAAGFCPQCGVALQRSDRFCPKCGAKI